MLAERKDGVLGVGAGGGGSLGGQLLASRASDNGRSQDESLERPERNTICKSEEIKVPEGVPFALIYAVSKSICEKRVTSKTLRFLDKEAGAQ